ncbi:MAG: LCP family protein [Thermoleophilia bacterium]
MPRPGGQSRALSDLAVLAGGALAGFLLARSRTAPGADVAAEPGPVPPSEPPPPSAPEPSASPPPPGPPAALAAAVTLPPVPPAAPARRRRFGWKRVLLLVVVGLLLLAAGIAAYVYAEARAVVGEFSAGEKQQVVEATRKELDVAPRWDAEARLAAEEAAPSVSPGPSAAPAVDAEPAEPPAAPPAAPPGREPEPSAAPVAETAPAPAATGAETTTAPVEAEKPPEPTTLLLIGSDRRWGETATGRSDTIVLVRLDEANDLVSVLSIPRDLLVPIPGYGEEKINSAYALGGAALLTATVRDYFGVRIDHFLEVTFDGFGDLVTQIGGVLLPVDQRYYVPPNSGHMAIDVQPGYQRLQRDDALSFVRFRHYDSDFHRAARQQLFLREVKRQIRESRYDFVKMRNLIRAFARASASDIDSVGELWGLANAFIRVPADRVTRVTLDASPGGSSVSSYLVASQTQLDDALRQFLFPRRQVKEQIEASKELAAPATAPKPEDGSTTTTPVEGLVVDDGGVGRTLIEPLKPAMQRCALTALPPGFSWPSGAARAYELEGSPAIAAYATLSSGDSLLLMQTTLKDPPVLASPSRTVKRGGREYEIWFESGKVRQVAWRLGPTRAWLTNTLRNTLTGAQLLALAQSCKPLR